MAKATDTVFMIDHGLKDNVALLVSLQLGCMMMQVVSDCCVSECLRVGHMGQHPCIVYCYTLLTVDSRHAS